MKLGQTITEIRKERKMTQEEFAQIFHVTRQTVSNWEKEKNYPDLETLIFMSEEFNISLDAMLKEDTQMVKKLNKQITFSKKFKKNIIILAIAVLIGAVGWGIVWNNARGTLEAKFAKGVEMNEFYFDEQLGHYIKRIDGKSYYTLPNQSMPRYSDFTLHFYNTTLDYYRMENDENIQIRWSGKDNEGKMDHSIYCLDENGNYQYAFSEKQEKEFCEVNTDIPEILKEGEKIYESVYE